MADDVCRKHFLFESANGCSINITDLKNNMVNHSTYLIMGWDNGHVKGYITLKTKSRLRTVQEKPAFNNLNVSILDAKDVLEKISTIKTFGKSNVEPTIEQFPAEGWFHIGEYHQQGKHHVKIEKQE